MPEKAKRHLSELDLTGRSFLTIHDFTPAEVIARLDLAAALTDAQKRRSPHPFLAGRVVAMIFMKTSTRTRVSFEIGIEQLGAQPMFLSANDIQLRVGETIKGFDMTAWMGLFGAANTPKDIVTKMSGEVTRIVQLPDVRARMLGQGAEPVGGTPQDLADLMARETALYAKIIKTSGIQPE